jgi:hypothetical protein
MKNSKNRQTKIPFPEDNGKVTEQLPGTLEEALQDNRDDVDELIANDLFKQSQSKTKYFLPFKTKSIC